MDWIRRETCSQSKQQESASVDNNASVSSSQSILRCEGGKSYRVEHQYATQDYLTKPSSLRPRNLCGCNATNTSTAESSVRQSSLASTAECALQKFHTRVMIG